MCSVKSRYAGFKCLKKINFPLVNNILSIYSWTSFCCTFAFQYKETRSSPLHRAQVTGKRNSTSASSEHQHCKTRAAHRDTELYLYLLWWLWLCSQETLAKVHKFPSCHTLWSQRSCCQPLPFLLVMIKTVLKPIPILFFHTRPFIYQEIPGPQSVVIFYKVKECWEIHWTASGPANSEACHQNTGKLCQASFSE